jgi:acetyl esterase/lipase
MTAARTLLVPFLSMIGLIAASTASAQDLPNRETYTFPPEFEPLAKVMEEAGFNIVYGPNSVPAPEGISEEAKKAWANLPQVPIPADDPEKLAAVRKLTFLGEDAAFERFKTAYSLEDHEINKITTLWITPPNLKHEDKVMIFIHGGGWVLNSRKTQLSLQTAVADSLSVKVVSIEYPLAPEHPYPAAVNDIVEAYQGIINEFGAENVGIFGTSAGGGLTLSTLLRLKADGLPLPAASAALSPGADMTGSGHLRNAVGLQDPVLPLNGGYFEAYVGKADPKDPLVSPVFGDYTGITPMFLLAGSAEIVGSDATRVAASARSQGVDVTLLVMDGMWHVPIADGSGVPELQLAFDELIKFFERQMGL